MRKVATMNSDDRLLNLRERERNREQTVLQMQRVSAMRSEARRMRVR